MGRERYRKMSADPRGVLRGQCAVCPCGGYTRGSAGGAKCSTCGHPPPKHVNLSVTANAGPQLTKNPLVLPPPPHTAIRRSISPGPGSRSPVSADVTASVPVLRRCRTPEPRIGPAPLQLSPGTAFAPRCIIPGCTNETLFDPNSGHGSLYCRNHNDIQYYNLTAPLSGMYVTADGNSDPIMLQSQYATAPAKASLWQPPVAQPVASLPPLSPPTQLPPNMQLPLSPPTQQIAPPSLPDHIRCKYPKCNRPRYQEPNGKAHEFCGRTHAREYEKLNHTETTVGPDMQCKTPQCTRLRRRMEDGKGYYDFCSLSCRDGGNQISSSSEPCSLPGCTRRKYVDPANGRVHDYCGRTHAKQAQAKGIAVKQCSLTKLQPGSQDFGQVQSLFQKKWAQGKGTCPTISCVFLVRNTQLETRWKQYQTTLPVQTVEQYYHGTKLTCDIVAQCTACNDSDCGVCGISQTGMDRRCIRKNINFQRFGHGFYLAPNSSKCHDYTQGIRKHRAMLQCDILPGKKHIRKKGDKNLTAPPQGCHSVYGQAGGELNYEELVVYNPDCVMPRFIIVYEKDGVHKIAK